MGGRSLRRCGCPWGYGQRHRGRDRKDEDARKRGRAYHESSAPICYSAIQDQPSFLGGPGPGLILAAGTRRTPSPRLHVHLQVFVLAKNLGSRGELAQGAHGKEVLRSHYTACRTAFRSILESGVTGCSPPSTSISAEPA